ncbi:hypothetical protein SNEBB_008548 [Seison nebaliae]|nr:hypothetical protein SNEBB_008548 [Seison nebaliae]
MNRYPQSSGRQRTFIRRGNLTRQRVVQPRRLNPLVVTNLPESEHRNILNSLRATVPGNQRLPSPPNNDATPETPTIRLQQPTFASPLNFTRPPTMLEQQLPPSPLVQTQYGTAVNGLTSNPSVDQRYLFFFPGRQFTSYPDPAMNSNANRQPGNSGDARQLRDPDIQMENDPTNDLSQLPETHPTISFTAGNHVAPIHLQRQTNMMNNLHLLSTLHGRRSHNFLQPPVLQGRHASFVNMHNASFAAHTSFDHQPHYRLSDDIMLDDPLAIQAVGPVRMEADSSEDILQQIPDNRTYNDCGIVREEKTAINRRDDEENDIVTILDGALKEKEQNRIPNDIEEISKRLITVTRALSSIKRRRFL